MKLRYKAETTIINQEFFIVRAYDEYHNEAGPADAYLLGSLIYNLGGETIWKQHCTPELWEKYGDPQIRNANKA